MHAKPGKSPSQLLKVSAVLTLVYIVLLLITGLRSHSLALLSEAGHNFSDFIALLLSLAAVYLQARPPSSTKTFGYDRAGVLAAFVNALTLVGIAFFIFYEAFARFQEPVQIHPVTMIWTASAGVLLNGVIAGMLFGGRADLNIRSVFLHMLGDTLSTVAVIVGGWAIYLTAHTWIDSALSVGIGALILWSSFGIIRESLNILLEGTPQGMEVERVSMAIREIQGVNDVHDLHIWSIGSATHALSCHISIADIPSSESDKILREVNERLAQRFHIHHTTIQFENVVCEVAHGCVIPTSDLASHGHSH